jgi:ABC-2 type transport system permease protein
LAGMNRGEFVAYYLVLILVNQFTYAQTNWTVGDLIREGNLSAWLLRPMPFIYQVFSTELAGKVVFMAFVVPGSIGLALIFKPEIHLSILNGLLFLPALIMAWWLRFLWGYSLALLAFWATRADALLALQDSLVFLLSGIVAPSGLLPQGLQMAAFILPFRYMVGFPVEVLCGLVSGSDLFYGMGIQAAWVIGAALLSSRVWKAGLKQYTALGG